MFISAENEASSVTSGSGLSKGWGTSTDDVWKVLIPGNPEVGQEMALRKGYRARLLTVDNVGYITRFRVMMPIICFLCFSQAGWIEVIVGGYVCRYERIHSR